MAAANGVSRRRTTLPRRLLETKDDTNLQVRNFVPKQAFTGYCWQEVRFFVKRTAWWRKQVSRTLSDLTESEEEVDALRGRLSVAEGQLRP
jgi:hypothetical protein